MPEIRRVALLIDATQYYGRSVLRGITHFANAAGHWDCDTEHWGELALTDGSEGRYQGAIIATERSDAQRTILSLGIPVVYADNQKNNPHTVLPDNVGIGRMGAEHLLAKGYRHFAFCGQPGRLGSDERQEGFEATVARSGYTCSCLPKLPLVEESARIERALIAAWLSSLPKPLGVMATDDLRARQCLLACREVRLKVPQDVAIIGADDDHLICDISVPRLSSVAIPAELIGYRAAKLLDQMMAGHEVAAEVQRVLPSGVVERQSTENIAIEDPDLVKALRFIQEHACEGIDVRDVLKELPISRRTLELKFRKRIGRTPAAEIDRIQLERIRKLLIETDLHMPEIARLSGFRNAAHMSAIFHKRVGQTLMQFRRSRRPM